MVTSALPPGFRFHPTDEELVVHYLKRKATGRSLEEGIIAEIDIYRFEPTELPGLSILPSRDPEWYFFNLQDRKYLHGSRTNRTTKAGYWKATGKDRKISAGNHTVGSKKTLIYYQGRAPHGERTDWVMHEYRLDEEFEKRIGGIKNPFVLCRVRRKQGLGPRNGEQYGAPVLEGIEDDEDNLGDVKDVASVECLKYSNVGQGPEIPLQVSVNCSLLDNQEDFDSLLNSLASFEEKPGLIDDGFDLPSTIDDDFNFIDAGGKLSSTVDIGGKLDSTAESMLEMHGNPMENLHSMLHRDENEADMLEELLHEIVDEGEIVDGSVDYSNDGSLPIEMNTNESFSIDDYRDFFELADLPDPHGEFISDLSPLDLSDIGFGNNTGIETRMGAKWVPESLISQGTAERRVRLQLDFPSYELKQIDEIHNLLDLEDRAVEVSSDESSNISDTNHLHSVENSENFSSGSFSDVLSFSKTRGIDHQSTFVTEFSTDVSLQSPQSQNSVGALQEQKKKEASTSLISMLSSDQSHTNESTSSIPNPVSPTSLLGVVLGFLENVPALPASALELSSANVKPQHADSMSKSTSYTESSLNVIRPLHQRTMVNRLNTLSESDSVAELSEWQYGGRRRARRLPHKGCNSNAVSVFLFSVATSALILFCLFRGFFKFTRSAFAAVL